MNYYLIAGVGFGEMRTVASKLIDKLSALHGADTVIRAPFGALRFWSHNAEQPNDEFVYFPSGIDWVRYSIRFSNTSRNNF